jgi:hypothetical protein
VRRPNVPRIQPRARSSNATTTNPRTTSTPSRVGAHHGGLHGHLVGREVTGCRRSRRRSSGGCGRGRSSRSRGLSGSRSGRNGRERRSSGRTRSLPVTGDAQFHVAELYR